LLALKEKENWSLVIRPGAHWLDLKLKEFWQYRDLVTLFVKRELVPTYKQTILGPLWFVLQPLLTTLIYSLIFGMVARIPVDGLPQILFYLPGIVLWNFFNSSFLKCSSTFISNAPIFGKVYFPRLVLPVSGLLASLVNFLIQFGLFLLFFFYYLLFSNAQIEPGPAILLVPVLILIVGLYSLGMGMVVSSFTTRYKDLTHFLAFGTQLLMYATPIIYPMAIVPDALRWINTLNPLSAVFEAFRYGFLGRGTLLPGHLLVSLGIGILIFFTGLVLFTRAERTSADTV
jgi:lipopolysaccharide transport system permease protein